jgi:general secretion pathway protein I
LQKKKVSNQRGFTLLEVLMAVIILGLSVTVLLQQFSVALRAGATSQGVTLGVLHAKQKLEELKLEAKLSETSASGIFEDGYEWETLVFPYLHESEDTGEATYENLKVETYQLESVVTWKKGGRAKKVKLTTLKTQRPEKWK